MDYHLKANSEQELWTALESVGAARRVDIKNETGEVVESRYVANLGYNIDVIGVIYKPTGNIVQQRLEDTVIEVPEMAAVEGFHANLRGDVDASLIQEIIIDAPKTPHRVWA